MAFYVLDPQSLGFFEPYLNWGVVYLIIFTDFYKNYILIIYAQAQNFREIRYFCGFFHMVAGSGTGYLNYPLWRSDKRKFIDPQ